ncbi:uncharacterized protein LOC109793072 [Cajanus cajan]|uniref:uncharacterized protein LOC109793072 n=1 Tax=Cajanus cajan TaxID=3821 RepID=UPI00098D7916|nr:uncharacterized protein LOC109793072 [Cajanus cajan]XP_029126127.1 uncharacterized protein LOC109793072 [Cajanus cajan]
MVPEGLNKDQWASFVDYRLDSKTKEKAQKNKENRKKQTIPHTGGSMSIARKKQKMELECGRKVSRGEIWIATHKHANGEFVNDEAKEIGEKIESYELSGSISKDISSQDSLAQTLGSQEHCGRVRGLGLGPCPSRVFGHTVRSYSGISSFSPSCRELQNEVIELKSQMAEQNQKIEEQNKRFETMMNFFAQNYQGKGFLTCLYFNLHRYLTKEVHNQLMSLIILQQILKIENRDIFVRERC